MKLPERYEVQMKELLGTEFPAYQACLNQPAFHGLRINTAKISVEEFLKISPFSLRPVPWCPNGFYYEEEEQPAKHPYYYAGLYYIQEPSAMLPASLLPVEPGERVLDICAAPGGKSTELAAKLNGGGLLVSNDVSHSRARALLKNLELFGASNLLVSSEPSHVIADRFPGYFDKILVDAPCSGEGMFRKSNSIVRAWEEHGVEYFVPLQRNILRDMAKALRPGGMLLYSTCTFSPEENEQAVEYLLELDGGFTLVDLPLWEGFDAGHPEWGRTGNHALTRCRRLWPHRIQGEGHFAALVKKEGVGTSDLMSPDVKEAEIGGGKSRCGSARTALPDECMDFLQKIRRKWDIHRLTMQKERVYYLPEDMPDGKGLRLLRSGLFLGEVKKNRFEPSQSLALALKPEEYENFVSLPACDERVVRYLKGETIELEGSEGLVLFGVDGFPLGWGKLKNGVLKNKYLTGWRWM